MADKKSSQSQNEFGFFQKALEGQIERMESWNEQVNKLQKQGFEQADQAMENVAALNRASMRYAQALTQDVWEIGIDAVRNAGELFQPKG